MTSAELPHHLRPFHNERGGYRYLGGHRFCSNGVASEAGHAIEHAAFGRPVGFEKGFDAVRRHLGLVGRPLEALCGFDLRIPASLTLDGFRAFNGHYLEQLRDLGLLVGDSSPLARTNVAPTANILHGLGDGAIVGFSYTVPDDSAPACFVISGVADVPDGAVYPDDVTRRGEVTDDALLEKLRQVVGDVAARIRALGEAWDSSASVHLYSGHSLTEVLVRDVLPSLRILPTHGVRWHDSLPPATELELEVDVRRYRAEHFPDWP